jgi:hypothetical protein
MQSSTKALVAAAAVAVIAGAVAWWWFGRPAQLPQAPMAPVAVPAPASPPAATAGLAPSPTAATIEHPIAPLADMQPLASAGLAGALADLIGRKAVLTFLQVDQFARRFVATVDNLGRSHAPPALWPVNPTPGRFMNQASADGEVISADNSLRYTPFVLLVETVDVGRAIDLYVRMYPLLQSTYEGLGFPRHHFNDRLFEVIDQLLATPEVSYPVRLKLLEIKGSVPSLQPWLRYQYAAPALESLSSGQKILLRVGPVNQRRLKAKLLELRQQLAARGPKR